MKLIPWTLAGLAALGGTVGAFGLPSDDDPQATAEQKAELRTLEKEYRAAQRARMEAYTTAADPSAQAKALDQNPWKGVAARFQALADAAEGTEVAATCWATIFEGEMQFGKPATAWTAFEVLVYDHTNSKELDPVLQSVAYQRKTDTLVDGLNHLLETTGRRESQAGALFCLARLEDVDGGDRALAVAYYERIVADYADVAAGRGQTYGAMAEGVLFESRHLQIGMEVPDIESVDETGAAFKLSDYRGKVVLVDFWGFW